MLHNEITRKFIEVKEVNGKYEIETPDGFKPIKRVMKTIPYQKWYLELEDGYHLEGADNHIVFQQNNEEIFLKDITPNDYIITNDGFKKCIRCYTNNEYENMYDIEVEGGIFYSNGIASHNTTAVSMYIIWYCTFNSYKTTAILANKDDTAKSILDDIKVAYENLPIWMKIGVTEYNAHTISFENGSKIFCRGTSKDACAGESVSFLYCDEFSLLPSYLAEEFYRANYPTISKGEKIIITSTARGVGNLFHSLWKGAKDQQNTYFPYEVHYWQVPEYSSEEWKTNMIADIGQIAFNSEYGNQFIGSQTTVVSADFLKTLKPKEPLYTEDIHHGKYKVFEEYEEGGVYLAIVDVSTGSGNDASVLDIFKLEWRQPNLSDFKEYEKKDDTPPDAIIVKLKQVAIFSSSLINIPDFVDYVFTILPKWGTPYFMFENNGIGQSFADKMASEYYWENTYFHEDSTTAGINSSVITKSAMITSLKKLAESGKLELSDTETINEFFTFVEKKTTAGNRRFQAEDGSHDDKIVTVGWGCFLAETNFIQDALTFKI